MGRAKEYGNMVDQRGYATPPQKNVCEDHFDEPVVKRYIRNNSEWGKCDYCGQKTKVIELPTLVDFLNSKISMYYGDIQNQDLYLASSFGLDKDDELPDDPDNPSKKILYDACGYAMPGNRGHYDYDEVLERVELGIKGINDDTLLKDICSCFDSTKYCLRDPIVSTLGEELIYKWDEFCSYVLKHPDKKKSQSFSTRYNSENGLADILTEIGKCVIHGDLAKKLPAGTVIYRSQFHDAAEKVECFSRIASPPAAIAGENRMSPKGVSMFYGAFDELTTVKEVQAGITDFTGKATTIGKFVLIKPIKVIDLTKLPNRLSYFEDYNYYIMDFLRKFVRDVSQPANKSKAPVAGRTPDYIPTQIVTDYFDKDFIFDKDDDAHGILYRSIQNPGGICCVLFYDNIRCPLFLNMDGYRKL